MTSIDSLIRGGGGGAALYVIDNCETEVEAAAVATWIAGVVSDEPDARVLVTAWRPLDYAAEHVVRLGPLGAASIGGGEPADVALLIESARAAGADVRDGPSVRAHAQRLGGIPLAIRLAARRPTAVTPSELADTIDAHLTVLSSHRPDERHGSLAATIDLAVRALPTEHYELLALLSAVVGPFTLEIATAMAGGVSRGDTVVAVQELVESGLVAATHGERRTVYRLLDPVRTYVSGTLAGADLRGAAMRRIADHRRAQWDALILDGSSATTQLDRLAALLESYPALLEWMLDGHVDGSTARSTYAHLQAVLPALASEVTVLGERLLERWPDGPDDELSVVLGTRALALASVGRTADASASAERALAMPGASPPGRVFALWARARVASASSDWAAAAIALREATEVAGDARLVALRHESLGRLGAAELQRGDVSAVRRAAGDVVASGAAANDVVPQVGGGLLRAAAAFVDGDRAAATEQLARVEELLDLADTTTQRLGVVEQLRFEADVLGAVLAARSDAPAAVGQRWRALVTHPITNRRPELRDLALHALAATAAARDPGLARLAVQALGGDHRAAVYADPYPNAAHGLPPAPGRAAHGTPSVDGLLAHLAQPPSGADDRPHTAGGGSAPDTPAVTGVMRRSGALWSLTYEHVTVQVRGLKGFDDIAVLVTRPHRDVAALELAGARVLQGAPGATLDASARRAYRERLRDLDHEIAIADEHHDTERAWLLDAERAALIDELQRAFGLLGPRQAGSTAERARNAVAYRIRKALRELAPVHPVLERHLATAIRTGSQCRYAPDVPVSWDVVSGPRA